ncbi:MAG: aromatic ring-hydroxylating dioxygenase subunit alpha [Pseudomonadota bacterium]
MSEDLALTNQAFEDARTPPGWVFFDAKVYEKEQKLIFEPAWLCVGHRTRLEKPGDFFVVESGLNSIIVMADKQNQPRAFHNVCRHRGTRLFKQQRGSCKGIKCPYHAWTYSIDGDLMSAPTMEQTKGFSKEDYPLLGVRLSIWNSFMFICLNEDTESLEQFYSGFPDLSHLDLHNLTRVAHHDYTIDANWKLVSENYNECYHCPGAHPQLHKVSDDRNFPAHNVMGKNFAGGPMGIKKQYNTMSISGVTERSTLTGWKDDQKNMIFYFCIYPNLYLSLAPDYLLTHYVWPKSADQVFIETEWFFSPEQIAKEGFDPADAIEFWDITNKQDWQLCENMMLGVRSAGYRQGRYHWWEEYVHAFDRWYVGRVFGG